MISYGKQSLDQSDINTVVESLKGDWLTQGLMVEKFENDLKNYFGSQYVCAVANGTAALHLTGLALGWQSGDIVITSPITFLATANCIIYAGATPDFVDIDPDTFTIDPNQLEEKIILYQSKGKKVKAVIGVDYAGYPCDWKALRYIADKYDLQLVNDNCHAMGASYYDDKQYAVKYADVVTQSYHPVKHITTGEGGAVITNDKSIDNKIRLLRSHGIIREKESLEKMEGPWYYEMHVLGFNYRITDFQCALGISQLNKLDNFVQKRRIIASEYDNAFESNYLLGIPEVSNNIKHAYHLYPLQFDFKNSTIDKKMFFKLMLKQGIKLQVHYIPLYKQPFYQKMFGFKIGDFKHSEYFYKNEISIPIYPSLLPTHYNKIIELILSNFK